jgi:UrcA family protein
MKTHNISKNIVVAAVAFLGVASVIGAQADEAVMTPTRTVSYSDLNLNTQAGAEKLYQRIRHAAEDVCGDEGSRQLKEVAAVRACVNKAVIAATSAVSNVRLNSVEDTRFAAIR